MHVIFKIINSSIFPYFQKKKKMLLNPFEVKVNIVSDHDIFKGFHGWIAIPSRSSHTPLSPHLLCGNNLTPVNTPKIMPKLHLFFNFPSLSIHNCSR